MKTIFNHKLRLVELLDEIQDKTILDYGCGQGDFVNLFLNSERKPKQIFAADSSAETVSKIRNDYLDAVNSGIVIPKMIQNPAELRGNIFDRVICNNVLECVDDKIDFINNFKPLLAPQAIFVVSHHDFDSAIYNSSYKELSRNLVHYFSDTQQVWQKYSDGQMGRKIPGLISQSQFRNDSKCITWRIVENEFKEGMYGFLMATMLMEAGKENFSEADINAWYQDLINKNGSNEYYFAIDLVVAICNGC